MKMMRYMVVTLVICSTCLAAAPPVTQQIQGQVTRPPLIFVITGESNSGGIGSNAQATPAERKARPCVQIMNLTNGRFNFEPLHLGVNNLRAHVGLQKYYDTCHGFENQLANVVETNAFPGYKQVYLIKTGHGGSRIAQWGGRPLVDTGTSS